jgi:hypothetical protein
MMKKIVLLIPVMGLVIETSGQDTAMALESKPVEIFSSERAINANTTETVGRGKLAFRVGHNFGDIAGKNGGIEKFFGLDGSTDVRIGFDLGLSDRFDILIARYKGGSIVQQLFELGVKYQLLQQMENGSGSPVAVTVFANLGIATQPENSIPDQENSFRDFGDRTSNLWQLIVARKFGNVSIAVLPSYVTRGYAVSYDQQNYFALGGIFRVPVVPRRLNILVDYFHVFRDDQVKRDYYENVNRRFYDPLGVGFELMTTGHVFRLNFTNSTDILANRFIPHTFTSWSKGQYRWGFTITRNFTLWR